MIWKDYLKLSEIANYSKLARASNPPPPPPSRRNRVNTQDTGLTGIWSLLDTFWSHSRGSTSRDKQAIRDQLEEHFCKRLKEPGLTTITNLRTREKPHSCEIKLQSRLGFYDKLQKQEQRNQLKHKLPLLIMCFWFCSFQFYFNC